MIAMLLVHRIRILRTDFNSRTRILILEEISKKRVLFAWVRSILEKNSPPPRGHKKSPAEAGLRVLHPRVLEPHERAMLVERMLLDGTVGDTYELIGWQSG